jgi:hypothetical protein
MLGYIGVLVKDYDSLLKSELIKILTAVKDFDENFFKYSEGSIDWLNSKMEKVELNFELIKSCDPVIKVTEKLKFKNKENFNLE